MTGRQKILIANTKKAGHLKRGGGGWRGAPPLHPPPRSAPPYRPFVKLFIYFESRQTCLCFLDIIHENKNEYLEKCLEHSEKHDYVLPIVRQPKAMQKGLCQGLQKKTDHFISVYKENYDLAETDR